MFAITTLTQENIFHPDMVGDVLEYGNEVITHYQTSKSKQLLSILEKYVRVATGKAPSTFEQEYVHLMDRLRYASIPGLYNLEELLTVFRSHFVAALSDMNMDVEEYLRMYLLSMQIAKRDAVKERIRQALFTNEEKLTTHFLYYPSRPEQPGTVGNWLKEYISVVGTGALNKVKETQFLTSGDNVKNCSEEERQRLIRLLHLYNRLRISSTTIEGMEEELAVVDPRDGVLKDLKELGRGRSVPILSSLASTTGSRRGIIARAPVVPPVVRPSPVVSSPTVSTPLPTPPRPSPSPKPAPKPPITNPPAGGVVTGQTTTVTLKIAPETDKKVLATKEELRKKGGDVLALFTALVLPPQGMNVASSEELIAGLLLLAENDTLEKAIVAPKLKEQFLGYLKSKNAPELIEGFTLTPTIPKFMSLFLQWVLQVKGKLPEHEAAQWGARMGNILKKRGSEKYARIAYFDAASNKFKWN